MSMQYFLMLHPLRGGLHHRECATSANAVLVQRTVGLQMLADGLPKKVDADKLSGANNSVGSLPEARCPEGPVFAQKREATQGPIDVMCA